MLLVSDAKTETNDKPSREAPIVSHNFEYGSLIQFGDPIQYGVIKQLQDEFAEVELVNSTKLFLIWLVEWNRFLKPDLEKTRSFFTI